jgi:hypothetical protein
MTIAPPAEIVGHLQEQWDVGQRRAMEPDWREWGSDYLPESPYLMQGRLSWWEPGKKVTWLEAERAPFTLGDVARRWVGSRTHNRRVMSFNCYDLLDLPQPLYFVGGTVRMEDGAYVDLTRAYYSLYCGRSYDMAVAITPTRVVAMDGVIGLEAEEMEWFAHDSEARNSVVGMARINSHTISRFGRIRRVPGASYTTSPGLWGYISLCLNAIAQEAVESFGAFYVGTDGYIVPGAAAPKLREHIRDRWNLDAKIAGRGDTLVNQLGRYRVGSYRSRRVGGVPGDAKDNIVRLERDQRDSLAKGRFR